MKNIIILGIGILSTAALMGSAQWATAGVVECSTKIQGKKESMKLKVNDTGLVVLWNKIKIVEAKSGSYFSSLTDLDNFGLEGRSSFFGKNGYRILHVSNTAETIEIGVSPSYSLGFYTYRDNGSGLGNETFVLICNKAAAEPLY
ncbi:MAG: hypothetical protein JST80_01395 [Bdellovibrionales bacterium]|nr:hypothetical protein [Bdellovibrionales bacterium]